MSTENAFCLTKCSPRSHTCCIHIFVQTTIGFYLETAGPENNIHYIHYLKVHSSSCPLFWIFLKNAEHVNKHSDSIF